MAEFAVAVTVLVTLLLGMPIIARYHELQVATIEGARQLAFQSSWRGRDAAHPEPETLRSALFPVTASADQPTVGRIKANFAAADTPGRAGQATRLLLAPLKLGAVLGSGFDLHGGTFYRADLEVTVSQPAQAPDPFVGVPVALSGTYALLGDDWASAGPAQVARRTGGLVITHAAQSLHAIIALGTSLVAVVEPAFRDFCPGTVDPEQVPADRLISRPAHAYRAATRWDPGC